MGSFSTVRRHWLRGDARAPAPLRPPWALAEPDFVAACTRCDACIGRCPQGVLRRGDAGFPEFRPAGEGCTFCGACVAPCPVGAIDIERTEVAWTS